MILFKLFWYKFFVYWKLKLLNFLMDSVLILIFWWTRTSPGIEHNSTNMILILKKRIEMLITSGAIHGYVPTSDILVVLARNFDVPKSQIYNIIKSN